MVAGSTTIAVPRVSFASARAKGASEENRVAFPACPRTKGCRCAMGRARATSPVMTGDSRRGVVVSKTRCAVSMCIASNTANARVSGVIMGGIGSSTNRARANGMSVKGASAGAFGFAGACMRRTNANASPASPSPACGGFNSLGISGGVIGTGNAAAAPSSRFTFATAFTFPSKASTGALNKVGTTGKSAIASIRNKACAFGLGTGRGVGFANIPMKAAVAMGRSTTGGCGNDTRVAVGNGGLAPITRASCGERLATMGDRGLNRGRGAISMAGACGSMPMANVVVGALPCILVVTLYNMTLVTFMKFGHEELRGWWGVTAEGKSIYNITPPRPFLLVLQTG